MSEFSEGFVVGQSANNANCCYPMVPAYGGYGYGGGMGMGGWNDGWWIILLLLCGWGNNGWGNNGNFGGQNVGYEIGKLATTNDVAAGFNNSAVLGNLNDLALGQANIQQTLCQGFNGVNTAILQGGYNTQAGINALSSQLAQCCCDNRAAIADVKYTIANEGCDTRHAISQNTRDIIDNANANSRAILDFLTQDKIATLTAENQSLKFAASQTAQNALFAANQDAQTAELIRRLGRDCPVPAYVVPNPNCCYGNDLVFGRNFNNCGCGCGC